MSSSEMATKASWDYNTDIVIAGAGAAGLAASIEAVDNGASVILIDENMDVGGRAILSGGFVNVGGGSSLQKKLGIQDSPDLVFSDLTDPNKVGYRYNDRELVRAFADNVSSLCDWLMENGVVLSKDFMALEPLWYQMGDGESVARRTSCLWNEKSTTRSPAPLAMRRTPSGETSSGAGLTRPLEESARKKGVQILLRHKLRSIIKDTNSGKIVGIVSEYNGKDVTIRSKDVIIATGGSGSNVHFRRIFDPRLTEEYVEVGEPWSYQTGDGEIAAMTLGASLWGTANQTTEWGVKFLTRSYIGCKYSLGPGRTWEPTSPVFALARATGLPIKDYQDVIFVNQIGVRFWNELDSSSGFLNAALAPNGGGSSNGGGPIWAIFDSDAVKRENWITKPPHVDTDGYFFSGNTFAELAGNIKNQHQKEPMPFNALEATIRKYNSYVEAGMDEDFGKPVPKYKIERPPFYAAWATPTVCDTLTGLRINSRCEVLDMNGKVIQGLYCAGESSGGFSQHGLSRAMVQGRIAGKNAANQ